MDSKHDVLVRLHEVSRQQMSHIAEGRDIAHVLSLLAAKQTLLDELNTLERQLDPFRQQDPETRHWRTSGDRQRCAQVAGRCQSLMGEILENERRCEAEMQRRRDNTAEQLRAFSNAAEAQAAYAAPATLPAGHCDLSSEA
jgi:hypothetical protein